MKLEKLCTLHMEQPLGIDTTPEFSWILTSAKRNVRQKGYRITLREDSGSDI